jgi:hypothetical protein
VAAKAAAAGLLAAIAAFVSYGAAAFLVVGGLCALALAPSGRDLVRRVLPALALAALTAGLLTAASALLGHDPLASARAALAIHREVYTVPRSYALWLLYNPLDFAVFLGVPVAVLALARVLGLARQGRWAALDPAARFGLALGAGLCVLLLSGVTRGEVGRIWIPLMPLALAATVAARAEPGAGPEGDDITALAALAGACSLAVRISWEF